MLHVELVVMLKLVVSDCCCITFYCKSHHILLIEYASNRYLRQFPTKLNIILAHFQIRVCVCISFIKLLINCSLE